MLSTTRPTTATRTTYEGRWARRTPAVGRAAWDEWLDMYSVAYCHPVRQQKSSNWQSPVDWAGWRCDRSRGRPEAMSPWARDIRPWKCTLASASPGNWQPRHSCSLRSQARSAFDTCLSGRGHESACWGRDARPGSGTLRPCAGRAPDDSPPHTNRVGRAIMSCVMLSWPPLFFLVTIEIKPLKSIVGHSNNLTR